MRRRKKKLKLKAHEDVVHQIAEAGCFDATLPEYIGESRAVFFLYESGLMTIMDEQLEGTLAVRFYSVYSHGE